MIQEIEVLFKKSRYDDILWNNAKFVLQVTNFLEAK